LGNGQETAFFFNFISSKQNKKVWKAVIYLLPLPYLKTKSNTSGSAYIQEQPQNFAPSPYLNTPSNKMMIHIQLVGMSMMFYYPILHQTTFA
jgi:hypothetical protein